MDKQNFQPTTVLDKLISSARRRSVSVMFFSGDNCRCCHAEALASLSPCYGIEKLGVSFTDNPLHADILVVGGLISPQTAEALLSAYDCIPEPRTVIAFGDCSASGGLFGKSYSVDNYLPVDFQITGCAAGPSQLIKVLAEYTKIGEVRNACFSGD